MGDTFNSVAWAVPNHPEVVVAVLQYFDEIIGIIDEDRDVVELVAVVQIHQKSAGHLVRRGQEQPDMQELVGFRIAGGVQPVVMAIDADRFLVDGQLDRRHRRRWLEIGGIHPVVDCNVTPQDAKLFKIPINIVE